MELPTVQHKLSAVFFALCLVQCIFASPISPSAKRDLLEQLRSRERRYTQQLNAADAEEKPIALGAGRFKRGGGSPIAFNPGLVVIDILRSLSTTIDNDRRRQQMSEAAAMNSELFTRVGRR